MLLVSSCVDVEEYCFRHYYFILPITKRRGKNLFPTHANYETTRKEFISNSCRDFCSTSVINPLFDAEQLGQRYPRHYGSWCLHMSRSVLFWVFA